MFRITARLIFLSVALAVILLVTFAACGGGDSPTPRG